MALNTNLVAFWSLEEASGTRVDDVGNNDLTPSAGGAGMSAAGKVGNCLSLASANAQYVSITDNTDLSVGDIDFTICAWVTLASKTAKMGVLIKGDSVNDAYYIAWDDGADRFRFELCSGANFANVTGVNANNLGAPVADGRWYFIVAWHNATADNINIKVNDTAETPVSYTLGSYDDGGDFNIGSYPAFSEHWNGKIDQVGFWKRVLTGAEITELYNSGNGRSYAYISGAGTTPITVNNLPIDSLAGGEIV